jgi:hypothetical protein
VGASLVFRYKNQAVKKCDCFFIVQICGKNRSPHTCGKVLLCKLSKTNDKRQTKKMTKTGHSFVANL